MNADNLTSRATATQNSTDSTQHDADDSEEGTKRSPVFDTPVTTDTVPQKFRERAQWVCWSGSGEDEMQAFNPRSGALIDSLSEGASLSEAERALDTTDQDGVGFVLLPDQEYVSIRLLNAVEDLENLEDVSIKDWAVDVIKQIDSYFEVGPFGDDVLLLIEGDVPDKEFEAEKVRLTSEGVIPITGRSPSGYRAIQRRQEELESVFDEHNESINIDEDVTLADVRETVVKNFDEAQWHLTEAILSTHAALFIGNVQNCAGLMVVGDSGAGKTTALRFFDGLDEQFYRSDEVTPASFVSHDASLTDEELQEVDLLPRIQHKSLLCRDMETWFSGDTDSIRSTMSRMTHLMDGEGLTRDSGSHGKRGYEGDLRFSFIGASTPLSPRAWEAMGNAGYRFVFYHKPRREDDEETLKENLFGESNYQEKIAECRDVVRRYLQKMWHEYDGYGGVADDEIDADGDAQSAITYLAKLVKVCRATIGDDDTPNREDPHRVGAVLRDIAKGRALLDDRTTVTVDDVVVSARIALSTMPVKRRELVRSLLDPQNKGQLTRSSVQHALEVSKPTALKRMKLLDTLGIADLAEKEDDDRGTKCLELKKEFEWPDVFEFPDR